MSLPSGGIIMKFIINGCPAPHVWHVFGYNGCKFTHCISFCSLHCPFGFVAAHVNHSVQMSSPAAGCSKECDQEHQEIINITAITCFKCGFHSHTWAECCLLLWVFSLYFCLSAGFVVLLVSFFSLWLRILHLISSCSIVFIFWVWHLAISHRACLLCSLISHLGTELVVALCLPWCGLAGCSFHVSLCNCTNIHLSATDTLDVVSCIFTASDLLSRVIIVCSMTRLSWTLWKKTCSHLIF